MRRFHGRMTLMLRFRWVLVFAIALVLGRGVATAGPDATIFPLLDGEPLDVTLPADTSTWTGRLMLPTDADALSVVASGNADVDLFLRYGRPANGNPAVTADVASVGDAHHELIALDAASRVPVRPGAWFVTVSKAAGEVGDVEFEIAAFVDRTQGRRTLLPGVPVVASIPDPGHMFAMRTWLPRFALGTVVDLAPPVDEGLTYRLEGPGGFTHRETTTGRIVIRGEDVPYGVHTLSLSAPARVVRPPLLTVRITWSFSGGFILPRPASPLLMAGEPLPVLMGGPKSSSVQPIRIVVEEGSGGFVLTATNTSGVNVDVYVRRGSVPYRRDEDAEWLGLSVGMEERVVVGGTQALAEGIYHAEVLLVDDAKPVEVVVTRKDLSAGEGPYTWHAAEQVPLEADTWIDGAVKVYESAITWHALDVPKGTNHLHAQLLDATGPLELVLASVADGRIVSRAFTPLVDEHLKASFSEPSLQDRRYYLGVLNRATWDESVTYLLAVSFDKRPALPDGMQWPPGLSLDKLTPAERTAASTVEITIGDCSGGSGVCVSPDGLILSCRHCLKLDRGIGGVQHDGIIVGFSQELEAPPIQAYYAKVLRESTDRDLVLLAPLNDVFGRPLPEGVTLPWLPIGDSRTLRLGQPLWVGGFPQVGSECTRTAVILSRGVVAGLERRPGGPAWLKTDAWVAPGHSGGPLVDAEGRLVGIAAATLGTTESLGLAIPIGRLPEKWDTLIQEHIEAHGKGPPPSIGDDQVPPEAE